MPAKKKMTKDRIISAYMDHVLENGAMPKSVYAFAKEQNFEEAQFYTFFGSFEAVEKAIFKAFFDNTMNVLLGNEEYALYDARNQLLSFYYTFFENLTANRSYVMAALHQGKSKLQTMQVLSELKHAYGDYIDELELDKFNFQEENINKTQDTAIRNSAWLQLLMTMKFWMEDGSPNFEKTDIFIEKSVNTSFDLMNTKPLKSVIDFGKFLLKEGLNIRTK